MNYLFEVSWEVCNKVGGIHTVLRSKAPFASKHFKDGYFLFGPLLDENPEFRETDDDVYKKIAPALESAGIKCKLGRWKIAGEPQVVLVDFQNRYDVNKLLYSYWRDFGLDSYAGRWDYIEPTLFSTACGEAIAAIHSVLVKENDGAVAHFHEWLTGGGVLHLKKHLPEVATVFTAHATMLGRCMSGLGRDIHLELDSLNSFEESKTYGIPAKHFMETVAAREADYLTTISQITSDEVRVVLGRQPDLVIHGGLDTSKISDYVKQKRVPEKNHEFLLKFARSFLQKDLPEETRLWITAGRYEYHNKGYDALLEAAAQLDNKLSANADSTPVVAFFLICAGHKGVHESVRRRVRGQSESEAGVSIGLTTHRLQDEQNDAVIRACHRLNLKNSAENKVNIIFSPAYLDGSDGVFDRRYEELLSGADLGIFPSFYEPWGYTPLESIAYGVPTVTTDTSGFGDWVEPMLGDGFSGVSILSRKGREHDLVISELVDILEYHYNLDRTEIKKARLSVSELAQKADWENCFEGYLTAYEGAMKKAASRFDILDSSSFSQESPSLYRGAQHSTVPHYRSFTVVSPKPEELEGLYEIAYNLWWSWSHDAREMFSRIDQNLWLSSECNPVQLLNVVPSNVLLEKAKDKDFLALYKRVYGEFKDYMSEKSSIVGDEAVISSKRPVVYFSMEFGLHECLPIYSGGLGVLAGDHLKSASDLNIPLIGVGLFYRQGYFKQIIDADGNQQEEYPMLDASMLPVKSVFAPDGTEARVTVELPGRLLHARVLEVQVGRVHLYLLDSDVEENEPQDRWLTAQLYGGDRRTRIKQEVLVGIGGARLVRDILKLNPSVYHMNEGHCAFLTLERMKDYVTAGLSYQEAREAIKASTAFTTHTPVPAGNESFETDLLHHYLSDYVDKVGIQWEQFLELGRERADGGQQNFSMTVLALKLSSRANAVAKLHGKVSRDMWKDVWKGVNVEEIPIFHITNGVHLQTWCSRGMRKLLSSSLPIEWGKNEDDPRVWSGVRDIPDEDLWRAHQEQKRNFMQRIKAKIEADYTRRGEDPQLIRDTVNNLSPDVLTIGFARRFASYKRANLLLRDWERIKRLLCHPDRPVQIIIAGKAHPADGVGKGIIREMVNAARSSEFKGRIVFLENYNMGIGRLLTRGVDVWLNNPLRPHEASGTSGMKLNPNGGLNFSILDGWWDEAYQPGLGWEISAGSEFRNRDHQDESDNSAMLDILENQIVPLYYDRNGLGFSAGWVGMMKRAISELSCFFSTTRMVREYHDKSYAPISERLSRVESDNYQGIKTLTCWKRQISSRFSSVYVSKVDIRGITSDLMQAGSEIQAHVSVFPGKLTAEELLVELVVGLRAGDAVVDSPAIVRLRSTGKQNDDGTLHFSATHRIDRSGNYLYAIRVVPVHELLGSPQETGLVCWGN